VPETSPFDDSLFQTLVNVSLTGVILFRPVYTDEEEPALVDFTYQQLNPAAQQMLGLPAQPTATFLTLYPTAKSTGIFAFYRDTFLAGKPGQYNVNYQADGLDNFFRLAAQRHGKLLLVSFTDTASHERSTVEQALRESQAREQAAHAAVELQRQQLQSMLHQAPAMICVFAGPQHVFEFVNPPYQALVGQRPLVGMPIAQAMPELADQPIFELLNRVYQTGETYYATEMLVQLDYNNDQPQALEKRYYNFIYQARHSLAGNIDGIFVFAYDVTTQVLARHQVQDLNEELAATNEELQAANEEYLTSNAALASTQQQLRQLNQKLETHVAERTQQLAAALAETEQQRAQLAQQQGQLQQILSQVPAAIATLVGPAHQHSFFNAGYQALAAGRAQLDQPVSAVFPEVVAQGFIEILNQVYATGEPFVGVNSPVWLHDAASGQPTQRYVDFVYQPLHDAQKQVAGILAFIVDVTEKVQAQQQAEALQAQVLAAAQRQSQERETFYQIFERTSAVIGLLRGPDHRLDYLNPALQQLFPGRQLKGRTVRESQPEVAGQGFIALLDHVYQTGKTYYGNEVPLHVEALADSPAETRYLNFTYQAFQEDGRTVGISVFAYDVTEQVLAREQRAAAQAQLQAVLEQAPVAIAIIQGPNYVIEVANPLVATIWGRTKEQLIGRPLFDALPEARDQGFKELLDGVVQTGQAFVAQEVTSLLERNGRLETVYLNFVYQPLRDEAGHIGSVALVATEVSKQVAARQQLAHANQQLLASNSELDEANQQLRRTNADLDNFIYTASHDLKAPITNIDGLLAALQEQLPPPVRQAPHVQQLLSMMQGAVERFQKTIAQLTDISKLQQANAQSAEMVSLAALTEDIRLDLASELAAAGGQLTVEVATCPSVSFAPKNLRSILYNLLSNGLKYRAPERAPVVQLRAYRAGTTAVLEVQDNGLGLDESQLGQLFVMFQRLHSHVEGSGIGLYMVKKIVENAGGSIQVQSQPGVGSTFVVTLPG